MPSRWIRITAEFDPGGGDTLELENEVMEFLDSLGLIEIEVMLQPIDKDGDCAEGSVFT